MNKHKLMILGSMDDFVELVRQAKQRGIYTIVCDGYENGPAKALADKSYNVDIRNVDKVAEICKQENIDGIISSFSDVLFEYLTKIASKAGLKTYCTPEMSVYLRDKIKMKEMFQKLGIPCPKGTTLQRENLQKEIELDFPVIMKPVDGYGSRGIFVVDSMEKIREKFDETSGYSTSPDKVLIEEYNDGYEFNMMTWVMDGEVYVIELGDREKTNDVRENSIPYVSRVAYPSRFYAEVYDEAKNIVKKVADFTGISTGTVSMQFYYKKGKGIQVGECAGRFFGYGHEMVEWASGFSIEKLLLDYVYDQVAMKQQILSHDAFYKKHVAGLYFQGHEGVVKNMEQAKKVIAQINPEEAMLYYREGEQLSHGVGAKPYLARIYMTAKTREELDEKTDLLYKNLKIYDENGNNMVYYNKLQEYERDE